MSTTPTPDQLVAFASFKEQGRWRDIESYIEAEIADAVTRMVESPDAVALHEQRGRIKALRHFQSMAREASKTLEKLGRRAPL